MKVALITGITGQDGTYLTELLLKKGYEVHGVKRGSSSADAALLTQLFQFDGNFKLHHGDLTDSGSLSRLVQEIQPDEIYNLGAMTQVQLSFEVPEYTANVDGIGTLRMLEAVRLLGLTKKTRIFQASTSELYGLVTVVPQNETTPFYPRTPYAVAKLYSYWIVVNYREAYNMYACNGILFNHESPIRGEGFVTRKITRAAAKIGLGLQPCLYVGNLSASRDWGHARDYVEAMWLMLQQDTPEDYVIASGITTTVRDFIKIAFDEIGIEVEFSGKNENERGVIIDVDQQKAAELGLDLEPLKMGQTIVRVDPKYFRPIGVEQLMGDPAKAKTQLDWKPKYDLQGLVKDMMKVDLQLAKKEDYLDKGGFVTQNHLE